MYVKALTAPSVYIKFIKYMKHANQGQGPPSSTGGADRGTRTRPGAGTHTDARTRTGGELGGGNASAHERTGETEPNGPRRDTESERAEQGSKKKDAPGGVLPQTPPYFFASPIF